MVPFLFLTSASNVWYYMMFSLRDMKKKHLDLFKNSHTEKKQIILANYHLLNTIVFYLFALKNNSHIRFCKVSTSRETVINKNTQYKTHKKINERSYQLLMFLKKLLTIINLKWHNYNILVCRPFIFQLLIYFKSLTDCKLN